MRNMPSPGKFIAFAMVVVTLTSALSGFALKKELLEPFRDTVSHKAFIQSDDEAAENNMDDDHKPRIYVLDHFSTWPDSCNIPSYSPLITSLDFYEPFRMMPEVYLEIFVPPESLA